MKRGVCLGILLILIIVSFISAQDETIKCYSSKDCPITSQYWCDSSSACQKLAQCLNPGTSQSECSVVDECVNCLNIGYLGCKDGQCQKINCYKDSECGESFTKKYCKGSSVCTYESAYFCQNSGTVDSFCNVKKTAESCTPCTYGCLGGVCQEKAQPTTCSDSDGNDLYIQGKTCSETICEVDSCVGNTLVEYGCVDNRVGVVFTYGCEKCENGACLTGTTTTPGCVQKGNTCCKGDICTGIACPQGQIISFKGCDSNCAAIGACQSTETVSEQVKCIFKNSKTSQKCYLSEYNDKFYCSGTETCVIDIKGAKGDKMTWKSTCGGYAYTILDGNSEYAEFDCSGETDTCQSTLCEDGSKTGCYKDEKGYCICSTCPPIIIKPVCGNGVCESGEGDFCNIPATACEVGKECKASTTCKTVCPEDCKSIPGVYAKLDEKFKLQISQAVKITDYKGMKINFRDLLTPKCEATTTNVVAVKEKLTGMAVAEEISSSEGKTEVSIIKCPNVGPMAQLEVINPEEMGKKILTLKLHETKNIYDVSVGFMEYYYDSRIGVFIVNSKLITCPENCKCDSEGYVLECKTEEKCEEGKMLCPNGDCKEKCEEVSTEKCDYGCLYNTQCLPIGVRVKGLYCGIDGTLTNQLKAEEICDNDFECSSNVCVSGKCISEGLIQKVLNWFKRLFGGKEAEILDCGGDTKCWENAFKVCKPAKISQQGASQESKLGGMVIEIIGLEGKKCVVKWTAKIEGSEESMKCKFENYTLGKDMVSGSMEQYCEGTLTYWLSSSSKGIVQTPNP